MKRFSGRWAFGVIAIIAVALVGTIAAWRALPDSRAPRSGDLASSTAATRPSEQADAAMIEHIKRELPIPDDFGSPQVRQLKRSALLGDKRAALELVKLYDACTTHNKFFGRAPGRAASAECVLEYGRWVRIAAENGGSGAQLMLVAEALKSTNCEDAHRARFWFEAARRQGSSPEDKYVEQRIAAGERGCHWNSGKR